MYKSTYILSINNNKAKYELNKSKYELNEFEYYDKIRW